MLLVDGESGVGKTRLLLELSRRALRRQVRVLAGDCVSGAVSRESREESQQQSGSSSLDTDSPTGVSGLRSVRVARGRSRRSPAGRGKDAPGQPSAAAVPLPAGGGGPLEALRRPLQAVADRCREQGEAETERLLGRRGKVLAAYAPELKGLPGQEAYAEPAELPPDGARLRLFSYLAETFEALAGAGEDAAATKGRRGSPLILMLDDLQWADELTLGFLEHWRRVQAARTQPLAPQPCGSPERGAPLIAEEKNLEPQPGNRPILAARPAVALSPVLAGAQPAAPLLIVGTYRSEEAGEALQKLIASCASVTRVTQSRVEAPGHTCAEESVDAFGVGEESAGRMSRISRLQLGRLAEASIASMVGDMLALSPPPELFARHVGRHSEGNPFFVAEYLRAAVDARLLWRDEHGLWQVAEAGDEKATAATYDALPLPRTLRELVGQRLKGLGRNARRLAEAAAVLGRESELRVLGTMLESARRRPLGEEAVLDALSELIRRQVLEVSSPGRLRFVHDKIREVAYISLGRGHHTTLHRAAAQSIASVHSSELAPHQAALGGHWDQAGNPDKARPCYLAAARQAVQSFDHAEAERLYRAYLRLIQVPTAESITARNELGEEILSQRGRTWEALSDFRRSLEDARRIEDPRLEAEGLSKLARVHRETGRMDQARQLFEQSVDMQRRIGNRRGEAKLLAYLGNLHRQQGRPQLAQQLLEHSLAIYRELGDRDAESSMLGHLGILHQEFGQPELARQFHEQAVAIHRDLRNRLKEAIALTNLAIVQKEQGQPELALQMLEQGLAVLREVGSRAEGTVLTNIGVIHCEQGRPEKARQSYEQALAIHRESGHPQGEGNVLGELSVLHTQQGRPELALQRAEEALAIHRELGNRLEEGHMLGILGGLHLELGCPDQALQLFEQALASNRSLGSRRAEGIVLGSLAIRERLVRGDLAQSGRWGLRSEELLSAVGDKLELGKLICERGHLELCSSHDGRDFLERAQELADATGAGSASELGKTVDKLGRAVEAFGAGEQHRLFRGQLIEDIPEGLRRWLRETGQLPAVP